MKSLHRSVVVAIALMAVIVAYAGAKSPLGAGSAENGGSGGEAAVVEAELVGSGLLGEIPEALGGAFGGIWFDRSTARLHVGVTSPQSRGVVEAAAAGKGLGAYVVATPVRSSWAELLATQREWGDRLAALQTRAEVLTAVRARFNLVELQLGSSIPPSRRADLERAAAASEAKVVVSTAPRPHIRIGRDAKTCRAFEEDKAYCDPTITAGVRIEDQGGYVCTAGPAVLPRDVAKSTETYILTAGHCMNPGRGREGVGAKWYAYPKNAKGKAERVEIGQAVEFIDGTTVDIGVIRVDNGFWKSEGATPVQPAVAAWSGVESEPKAVTGEQLPVEGLESCMSGQSSGTVCGKIEKYPVHAAESEGLAEVNATRKPGDSGGPWYSKGTPSIVEGTHVGFNEVTKKPVFEPIKTSFAKLSTKLRLLTASNKNRTAFLAEKSPVTLTGNQDTSHVFTLNEKTEVVCGSATFSGTMAGESVQDMTLNPLYKECVLGGMMNVTITATGCAYTFDSERDQNGHGVVTLVCGTGQDIVISGPGCTVTVAASNNQDLKGVSYVAGGSESTADLTIETTVTGIHYVASGFLCGSLGFAPGTYTNGWYQGSSTVTGRVDGGSEHVGIGIH